MPGKKPNSAPPKEKLTPTCNDVLLGRGNGIASFEGNVNFRRVVWTYRDKYNRCSRQEKSLVAKQVMALLRGVEPPARFLEVVLGATTNPGSTGRSNTSSRTTSGGGIPSGAGWVLASESKAMEKVCQALREKKSRRPQGLPKSTILSKKKRTKKHHHQASTFKKSAKECSLSSCSVEDRHDQAVKQRSYKTRAKDTELLLSTTPKTPKNIRLLGLSSVASAHGAPNMTIESHIQDVKKGDGNTKSDSGFQGMEVDACCWSPKDEEAPSSSSSIEEDDGIAAASCTAIIGHGRRGDAKLAALLERTAKMSNQQWFLPRSTSVPEAATTQGEKHAPISSAIANKGEILDDHHQLLLMKKPAVEEDNVDETMLASLFPPNLTTYFSGIVFDDEDDDIFEDCRCCKTGVVVNPSDMAIIAATNTDGITGSPRLGPADSPTTVFYSGCSSSSWCAPALTRTRPTTHELLLLDPTDHSEEDDIDPMNGLSLVWNEATRGGETHHSI